MNTESKPKVMRVIKLEVSNIKRVNAVEVIPGPNAVVITGKNDQGKSSVIDSLEYALSGGKSIPELPLRKGAKSGYIVADLDDIVVERTFTNNGTSLTVRSKDGTKLNRPQDLLDGLCSKISFDPLAFVRMKPDQQAEMLKKLVGLDFTELNADRKRKYDERTIVNRNLEQKKAALAGIPAVNDAPEAEVSIQEIIEKLNVARKHNKDIEEANSEVDEANKKVSEVASEISRIQGEIARLQAQLAEKQKEAGIAKDYAQQLADEVAKMKPVDTAAIEQEMTTLDARNAKFRQAQRRKEVAAEVKQLQDQSDKLTEDINNIDDHKNTLVSKAKFPIDGLSFDEVGVMLNGVPFSQGSQARQIQAAIAIGIALNPTVRVILVRDASLLDESSLQMVKDMAEKHDAQVWLEIVSSDDPKAVVIEDGRNKE